MVQDVGRQHGRWQDLAAALLALGYIGGFLAAMEYALARLVFLSAF